MRPVAAVLVLLALLAAPAAAATPEIIAPAAIRAGMRGYGLTVFQGDILVRFEVEALGVLVNAFLVAT